MNTLVVLEYPMVYTKFQGHRSLGSEEEDFLSLSPYMAMVMWLEHLNKYSFSTSHGGSVWNLALIGLALFEQKKFENVESEWPWM